MYAMTEVPSPRSRLGQIGHYHGLAGQAGHYWGNESGFPSIGIHVPGKHGLNHAPRRIEASTRGPGKPPEAGGTGGGGGAGNPGGGSGSGGPRDQAKPVNYGETGGGTSEDSNPQAGANAGVVGAHGGTDAAAGATPAGTAGTLERAPGGPESGKDKQQAESARATNAPLSPPGRDQSKPDSPLFGDKADAPASADGGGSPAAGAAAAGATGLGEVASADNTRNDASTTGGTGITGDGGSSDAGRR